MHDTQIVFWKDEKYSVMNATKNRKKKFKKNPYAVGELSVIYAHVTKAVT